MTIFIGNILEEALPLVALMNPGHKRQEIEEDLALNDRFLLSQPYQNKILVTPLPLNQEFLSDLLSLSKARNILNLSPQTPSNSICQDILSDKILQKKIARTIGNNKTIDLISYVASQEFYELVQWFKIRGFHVSLPEAPAKRDAWTVSYFDSKAGFAKVIDLLPLTPGIGKVERFVAHNYQETLALSQKLFAEFGGVVVKTSRGLAGMGLRMLRKSELGSRDFSRALADLLAEDPFWRVEPVIVEQYIDPDIRICGGQPSFELWIDQSGKVHPLYSCGMRVTPAGSFRGMELGVSSMPKELEQSGFAYCLLIGEYLAKLGYRGFFDVDMIIGRDGRLYPLEANLRRTGGTHVYELARRLLGPGWLKTFYLVSNNMWQSPKLKNYTYERLKKHCHDVLYPIAGKKRGVIVTMSNYLSKGYLGYLIIGNSKADCYLIEKILLFSV